MKISVIIPCFNEENTIIEILKKVNKQKKNFDIEVIISDDGSTDRTINLLDENIDLYDKLVKNKNNLGKGSAIKKGLEKTEGDIIIFQDADLEYDPNDYRKLVKPFLENQADVVYGSRFLGGGKYVRIHFFWHYLANKILTFICNIFINLNLTDMETGYKVFRSSVLKDISLKEKTFSFEPEITIKLSKKKCKFYEVPITYNGRSYEDGKKIGLKDAFIALKAIFLYSFKS
jgi:glycosyltransferase involved in cell wall biosynthesis